jgi:SAM-dependent methyltransferase
MTIYDAYAPFYDGSGQMRFALLTAHYLAEVLARHPPPGRTALDLACGTGTLAITLAEQGWHVVGLDQSPTMLALARAKAEAAGVADRVAFVQGDMREPNAKWRMQNVDDAQDNEHSFCILHFAFSLVTCTYDSLNYLLDEADLARCFTAAAQVLVPGGVLYADMNTRHFLEHDWPPCEISEQAGLVQIAQSRFEAPSAMSTMRLTGFAGDDERGYRRFDETHVERAYPPELVAQLLAAAGLQVEAAYECFTFQPHHPRSQRIAWVGRRV